MHWYLILNKKLRINKVSELFEYMHPNLKMVDNKHDAIKAYVAKGGDTGAWGTEPICRQAKAANTVKETADETLAKYTCYEDLL